MLDQTNTALLFPGQGSQVVGMGKSLADAYHIARQTLEEADEVLGFSLSELCFNGPDQELSDTANAQAALYAVGIAALRTLYEALGVTGAEDSFQPAAVAGHSLGEFTALTAAGVLSFQDGLRLVRTRGELMRDAGETNPGSMLALLGATIEGAEQLCQDTASATGKAIVVANDNCPGQVVISGDNEAIDYAEEHAKDYGGRRAIKLNVSVATHSPLMANASDAFREALAATPMHPPTLTVIGNTTAAALTSIDDVTHELDRQLVSTVRWTESMQNMIADGVTTFVEVGSGDVLSKLMKRIDKEAVTYVVDSPEGIQALQSL